MQHTLFDADRFDQSLLDGLDCEDVAACEIIIKRTATALGKLSDARRLKEIALSMPYRPIAGSEASNKTLM